MNREQTITDEARRNEKGEIKMTKNKSEKIVLLANEMQIELNLTVSSNTDEPVGLEQLKTAIDLSLIHI